MTGESLSGDWEPCCSDDFRPHPADSLLRITAPCGSCLFPAGGKLAGLRALADACYLHIASSFPEMPGASLRKCHLFHLSPLIEARTSGPGRVTYPSVSSSEPQGI